MQALIFGKTIWTLSVSGIHDNVNEQVTMFPASQQILCTAYGVLHAQKPQHRKEEMMHQSL